MLVGISYWGEMHLVRKSAVFLCFFILKAMVSVPGVKYITGQTTFTRIKGKNAETLL